MLLAIMLAFILCRMDVVFFTPLICAQERKSLTNKPYHVAIERRAGFCSIHLRSSVLIDILWDLRSYICT